MRSILLAVACLAIFVHPVRADYKPADLQEVPVERLIENLTKAIEASPKDSVLRLNLARVHGMAYASKSETAQTLRKAPEKGAWYGYEPKHVPVDKVVATDDAKKEEVAQQHLAKALASYEETIKLDPDYLTARLGQAWCLEQAGKRDEAIKKYREVIEAGWESEKRLTVAHRGWHSITAEAAGYLMPLLDPQKDEKELTELKVRIAALRKVSRPVTPIAIPMGSGHKIEDLLAPQARVRFDVDGRQRGEAWSWITPNAGWLVHDRSGRGEITSGLQLFGNVSFWLFWDNGYQALAALDNNRDGRLAGGELAGLAIWHDRNSNGVSEPGEVRPLAAHGIVALSCQGEADRAHAESVAAFSPRGVEYSDGRTAPTFDFILRPAK